MTRFRDRLQRALPGLAASAAPVQLTPRQRELFALFREKMPVEEVMSRSGLARSTVMDYLAGYVQHERPGALEGIEILVATDVSNPLIGPLGAATVYGPQKGASSDDVDQLEAALFRYSQVVRRHFGVDIATLAGGGAAGGLAAGLVAFLGAKVRSGFDLVAEATGFASRLAAAKAAMFASGAVSAVSRR